MNKEIDRKYYARFNKEELIEILLSYDSALTTALKKIDKAKNVLKPLDHVNVLLGGRQYGKSAVQEAIYILEGKE